MKIRLQGKYGECKALADKLHEVCNVVSVSEFRHRRIADTKEGFIYIESDSEYPAEDVRRIWYAAVLPGDDDDTETGSYDLNEALRLARGIGDGAYIVLILEGGMDNVRIGQISADLILEGMEDPEEDEY